MNYRLEWRLVGRASRLLDQGEIDSDLVDRASALQALHAFLATFALRGRSEAAGYWWGGGRPMLISKCRLSCAEPLMRAKTPARS